MSESVVGCLFLLRLVVTYCMGKHRKIDECDVLTTICLSQESNKIVRSLQAEVLVKERRATYNKEQAINRIIHEWHQLTKAAHS